MEPIRRLVIASNTCNDHKTKLKSTREYVKPFKKKIYVSKLKALRFFMKFYERPTLPVFVYLHLYIICLLTNENIKYI